MIRRPLFITEEEEKYDEEHVKTLLNEISTTLAKYLDHYKPKTESPFTKHAIMGPVGKLIPILTSGRLKDKNAIIGYVINIHRNTSASGFISKDAVELLNSAVDKLIELRNCVRSTREWLKCLRELDYSVFKLRMEKIIGGGE